MVEAAKVDYTIPFAYKKIFSPQECTELVKAFKNYDKNNDGTMDSSEFKQTLKDVGHGDLPDDQVQKMLESVDRDHDNLISFPEFLDVSKFNVIISTEIFQRFCKELLYNYTLNH